jgi:single-stranded DNA-binding protein
MKSVNKVIVLGNLTRDPELKHTEGKKPVCPNDEIAKSEGRGQHREKLARHFPCCHTCCSRIS